MMKHPILFVVTVCIFCFSTLIQAQDIHIKLVKTKVTKYELKQMKLSLNTQLYFYDDLFGGKINKKLKLRIFGSEKEYKEYAWLYCAGYIPPSNAFYTPLRDEMVIYKTKNFISDCFHELSHAILEKKCPHCVTWLNEGLAEYFGKHVFLKKKTLQKTYDYTIDAILEIAKSGEELITFMNLNHQNWNRMEDKYAYGLSWGIVYFLYQKDYEMFKEIVKDICRGIYSEHAIEKSYPGGFKTFFKELKSFYEKKN